MQVGDRVNMHGREGIITGRSLEGNSRGRTEGRYQVRFDSPDGEADWGWFNGSSLVFVAPPEPPVGTIVSHKYNSGLWRREATGWRYYICSADALYSWETVQSHALLEETE